MESTCYGAVHNLQQQDKAASNPVNQIQMRHTSDGEARDALGTHRVSYSDASLNQPSASSPAHAAHPASAAGTRRPEFRLGRPTLSLSQ
jgi:hypothetical protein